MFHEISVACSSVISWLNTIVSVVNLTRCLFTITFNVCQWNSATKPWQRDEEKTKHRYSQRHTRIYESHLFVRPWFVYFSLLRTLASTHFTLYCARRGILSVKLGFVTCIVCATKSRTVALHPREPSTIPGRTKMQRPINRLRPNHWFADNKQSAC